MRTPAISVVVVSLAGRAEVARCLEALSRQNVPGEVEIIVPCDAAHSGIPALAARFSGVLFPRLEGRRTPAEVRTAGVTLSRAPVVALTEDHCLPEPDWCSEILAAHNSAHAAVGGAVEKQAPDTALNWSLFFADYLRYMNPLRGGPTVHLTDGNVSYKRAALNAVAAVWSTEFHENLVHGALRSHGYSLWLCPRAVVRQKREFRLATAIWDRYAFARLFASTRVENAPVSRRLFFAATTPLLPFLLIGRILMQIVDKRRCAAEFLRCFPHLVLITSVWAWGELVGYVTGQPERLLAARRKTASVFATR
jgi:hypothetical protein